MFWYTKKYKNTRNAAVASMICLATVVSSCTSPSDQSTNKVDIEFDIPAFFANEIHLLTSSNPNVNKTVKKDNVSETKKLTIADWEKELANFSAIDLNKPAYRGSYTKDSIGNTVTYSFTDSSLDLSVVRIVYENGIPSAFSVKKSTKNLLYDTEEHLEYVKGKSYSVDKIQNVKLMGSQHYEIKGVIE